MGSTFHFHRLSAPTQARVPLRAVRFHYRPVRYLLTRAASRRMPGMGAGPLGFVRLDQVPPPELPGPDWVRLRSRLSGICGSDLGIITAHDSFSLEPYGAYPFTFGHEVVATVVETGPEVSGWKEGDRVILHPMLACRQKGVAPCPACDRGDYGVCRSATDGQGGITGFSPLTGGGWSDMLVAHESQLLPQGDLPDEVAVLTDPFASAARGVFQESPEPGDVVLVIGGGTIGLLTVRALRLLGWDGTIAVATRYGFQARRAEAAGADLTLESTAALYDWAASLPGAALFKPTLAPRFVEGGPSLIYDTVGAEATVRDGLALAREGGRIVIVGAAARTRIDLTRLWHRAIRMTGIMVYGAVTHQDRVVDIFDAALELIRGDNLDQLDLLTHTFELEEYRDAISVALSKRDHESIKVAFRPG
jgi:threonine dehydrogenase-like Zn-dependent dehydrogenase